MNTSYSNCRANFLKNIEILIQKNCHGNRAEFNRVVGQRGADWRWRSEGHDPRFEAIVKIADHFNISIDWLLGIEKATKAEKTDKNDEIILLNKQLQFYKDQVDFYKERYALCTCRKT